MSGLTALDRMMLEVDRRNPPVITALFAFDAREVVAVHRPELLPKPEGDAERVAAVTAFVRDSVVNKFKRLPRFQMSGEVMRGVDSAELRKVGLVGACGNEWDDAYHFRSSTLRLSEASEKGAHASHRDFNAALELIEQEQLDYNKPLWTVHVIHNVRMLESVDVLTAMVVVRIHHAIGDGVALFQLLSNQFADIDAAHSGAGVKQAGALSGIHRASRGNEESGFSERRALSKLSVSIHGCASSLWSKVQHTFQLLRAMMNFIAQMWTPDGPSPLLDSSCAARRKNEVILGGQRIPFDDVKRAAKAAGMTFTELVLVSIASGIRGYFKAMGVSSARQSEPTTGIMPFNMRSLSCTPENLLINNMSSIFVTLPTHHSNVEQRIADVRVEMRRVRSGHAAMLVSFAYRILALLPISAQTRIWSVLSRRLSTLISTVPAPSQKVSVGGVTVHSIVYWAPTSSEITNAINAIAYGGSIWFGVRADRASVPRPELLLQCIYDELEMITSRYTRPERPAFAGI